MGKQDGIPDRQDGIGPLSGAFAALGGVTRMDNAQEIVRHEYPSINLLDIRRITSPKVAESGGPTHRSRSQPTHSSSSNPNSLLLKLHSRRSILNANTPPLPSVFPRKAYRHLTAIV